MLQRQLPDLRVEDLEIRHVRHRFAPAKHVSGPRQQLLLPFCDLGGMDAKLLGQFCQRLVTLARRSGYLSLECRSMIASRSLHHLAPWFAPEGVG